MPGYGQNQDCAVSLKARQDFQGLCTERKYGVVVQAVHQSDTSRLGKDSKYYEKGANYEILCYVRTKINIY